MTQTDIFIIGGGINGTAIAADAAGRGLSVTLCEKNDLASGTSSASTKLIHGGLRYLEQYDFRLVRNALNEREILMRRAPNVIKPLEFVLPYENHLRPAWLIRLGLFLYDHLAARKKIPGSQSINLRTDTRGKALQSSFSKGFSYYDCFTDDARLTVLNALSAKENGAVILTRHEFISAKAENNGWLIEVKNCFDQSIKQYQAKVLINAAGPWINQVQQKISQQSFHIKLVKGSHIIVPKLYSGNFAYILQNKDNRVIFAIPYQQDFTLIGTTDTDIASDFHSAEISDAEKVYLCTIVNNYFNQKISPENLIWSYSGVRCLQGDGATSLAKLSREHKIDLRFVNSQPLMTIIGGKLTTHRSLAEEAINKLGQFFKNTKPAWTSRTPLPGCDFPENSFEDFFQQFSREYPWLPEQLALHYAGNYGTRAKVLLQNCHSMRDLGDAYSTMLFQREVDFLIEHEWAKTADDILWRRTKTGLVMSEESKNKLRDYCL